MNKHDLNDERGPSPSEKNAAISASDFWSRFTPATQYDLNQLENRMNTKIIDLTAQFQALAAQMAKADAEVRARLDAQQASIDTLTKQLGDAELSPEAQAALDDVKAKTQALDDIVPDAPPAPTPTPAAT